MVRFVEVREKNGTVAGNFYATGNVHLDYLIGSNGRRVYRKG
jgi:hypothetical protein